MDRGNLGKQTEKDEFANFEPTDDPRRFPTLYTVQRLKSNAINPAAKVVITTIQRLYSMLKGDTEFDGANEEGSSFDSAKPGRVEPPDVVYNAGIPPEFFDFIIVDECHRSIYELWSQVLLYFALSSSASPPRPPARPSVSSTRTWSCGMATTRR